MNRDRIQRSIDELGPWFYAFDFGHGLTTTPVIPSPVAGIHLTRLAMLERAVGGHGEMCVIETQVVDEVEGFAEWGSREWTRPYQGIVALVDETGEFKEGNRETGVTPMATCPSPKALRFMLRQAGFARAEILTPPPDAYEQHARGKRVVCAAFK